MYIDFYKRKYTEIAKLKYDYSFREDIKKNQMDYSQQFKRAPFVIFQDLSEKFRAYRCCVLYR